MFLETGVIKRHIYHLMPGFGISKSVLQKQSVLLRAEVTSDLCTKMRKKHKFDNDLTALVLTLANSKIHQNKEKIIVFFETGVINRHIYHLVSACGTTKSVLQKQRRREISAILSIVYRNYRQMAQYKDKLQAMAHANGYQLKI